VTEIRCVVLAVDIGGGVISVDVEDEKWVEEVGQERGDDLVRIAEICLRVCGGSHVP
jgi:hypothetical protein